MIGQINHGISSVHLQLAWSKQQRGGQYLKWHTQLQVSWLQYLGSRQRGRILSRSLYESAVLLPAAAAVEAVPAASSRKMRVGQPHPQIGQPFQILGAVQGHWFVMQRHEQEFSFQQPVAQQLQHSDWSWLMPKVRPSLTPSVQYTTMVRLWFPQVILMGKLNETAQFEPFPMWTPSRQTLKLVAAVIVKLASPMQLEQKTF